MDRFSVRSFRAVDLAEHGIRDLARSRLDTGREVVFQPLGARFFAVRGDPARIVALFREDAFQARDGHFSRMVLPLNPLLAERLDPAEPRAVEARLEEATRNAIRREFLRTEGVYVIRFEPSARQRLEPVAHVHLSCRLADGSPAQAITRDDARRFEATWNREVDRVFGLSRGHARELKRERAHGQAPVLSIESDRSRHQWARAAARLFAVYTERLSGKTNQQELVEAAEQARAARVTWSRQSGGPVDLRDVARRQVFDVVRLRLEGGSRYLSGPLEAQRRMLLEAAASRAAGLPDGRDRRVAVVAWPAGRDLHAAVYFNQRSAPERLAGSIEPERLRSALEAGLRDEILSVATSLDHAAEARTHELGRVEARLTERAPAPARAASAPDRSQEVADLAAPAAIVISLHRDPSVPALTSSAPTRDPQEDARERMQAPEWDWARDRVFSVRLRVPTGAEQLDRVGLNATAAAPVLQRAVGRAFPFLERAGIRDNFVISAHGRALDVQIIVPDKLGWTANELRSPQFQQRFIVGFHQALAETARTRIASVKEPLLPGFARGMFTVPQLPQRMRQAEQDPERAARVVARAVFSKLSEALPKPFRLMRDLGRTVSRFVPRGE